MAPESSQAKRPTRKEIDLYYKTHRSQFRAPERVHVVHIVKNIDESTTREQALAVMNRAQEELDRGTPFPEVAEKFSDCGNNGGELGWFSRGVMVEEFEQVVFDLRPGETTGIFETRFGFHVARLIERRPEEILPLREIYEQLAEGLYRQRMGSTDASVASETCRPTSK
jgi:peptidyl-prolyl cis-trans isomerase C